MSLVVDPARLAKVRAKLPPAAFQRVIGVYIEHGGEQVANLEDAFNSGDLAGVQHASHTLRSSTGILGMASLMEAVTEIEELCRARSWPLPQHIHRVKLLYHKSVSEIRLLAGDAAAEERRREAAEERRKEAEAEEAEASGGPEAQQPGAQRALPTPTTT